VGAVNVIREPGFLLFLAIALVAAGIASTFILAGREIEAGWMVALTGAALVGARWTAARSSRLLLVGAVAERLSEAAVFGAICWLALPVDPRRAGAAIIALGGSYLAAYLGFRAAGLGFRVSEPVWFPAAVWVVTAGGLVLGLTELALWSVVLLSAAVLAMKIAELSGQREPG
jgi:hypothetical protein